MDARESIGLRNASGYAAVTFLALAVLIRMTVGSGECMDPHANPCPEVYSTEQIDMMWWAAGAALAGLGAAAMAAAMHVRARRVDPAADGIALSRPRNRLADRLLIGGASGNALVLAVVFTALQWGTDWDFMRGQFGTRGLDEGESLFIAWTGIVVAGLSTLAVLGSLAVRPYSPILHRWLAIPFVTMGVVAGLFSYVLFLMIGLG